MRAYDIIYKKREGKSLNADEIKFLINGFSKGTIPDYQMSAWAMAVFFNGMNADEISCLTLSMAESGEQLDLSMIPGIKVDKHSTGGVGDTTTLVLAPLVSAAGVPVAKMSGRGLGHTGGTIDKLESIPDFKTTISMKKFIENLKSIGLAVVGQSGNLTPADKKLYALRDVTATVDSIPLIASSIMSKKIAAGADGIVLDVKTGNGAFMKDLKNSRRLAETMVEIGKKVGRKTIAVITDMNQPLGLAVGNALEVKEAIDTLKGKGPQDLEELCLTLGANMLIIAEKTDNFEEAYKLLKEILYSGKALGKFKSLIEAQGGNPAILDDNSLLPQADFQLEVYSDKEGYIFAINALEVGITAMLLGAGRARKEDQIDLAVGITLNKKCGDKVKKGEPLAVLHINDKLLQEDAINRLKKAFTIKEGKPDRMRLIYEIIK